MRGKKGVVLLPEELGAPVFSASRVLALVCWICWGMAELARYARPESDAVNGEPTRVPTRREGCKECWIEWVARGRRCCMPAIELRSNAISRSGRLNGRGSPPWAYGQQRGVAIQLRCPCVALHRSLVAEGPASPTSCTALPNLAPTLNTQKTYRPPVPHALNCLLLLLLLLFCRPPPARSASYLPGQASSSSTD